MNEVAESVSVLGESGGEAVDFAAVNGLKATAGGVGEHFLSKTPGEIRLAFEEHLLEGDDVGELIPIGEHGGRINLRPSVGSIVRSPSADGVEVFKGESHWINLAMATSAGFVGTMALELFADGLGPA